MASSNCHKFSEMVLQRKFSFPLLYQFLHPYRDYLCSNYDFRWTESSDKFPMKMLAGILSAQDDEMPDMLRNGLFFIDALLTPDGTKRLFEILRYENLLPAFPLSPNDYALFAWQVAPGILQELHAELAAEEHKKSECIFGKRAAHPDLSKERLLALEDDLNTSFDLRDGKHGIQLTAHHITGAIVFHVRHGELSDGGKNTGRIVNRVEHYDFLTYSPEEGKLEIYSDTSWKSGMYYVLLAKHLFGDLNFFALDDGRNNLTLAPLLERGKGALICGDVNGLKHVLLKKVHVTNPKGGSSQVVFEAETCIFDEWKSLYEIVHPESQIVQASFLMFLSKINVPRALTVCTPRVMIFDRDAGVGAIYNQWLRVRNMAKY